MNGRSHRKTRSDVIGVAKCCEASESGDATIPDWVRSGPHDHSASTNPKSSVLVYRNAVQLCVCVADITMDVSCRFEVFPTTSVATSSCMGADRCFLPNPARTLARLCRDHDLIEVTSERGKPMQSQYARCMLSK